MNCYKVVSELEVTSRLEDLKWSDLITVLSPKFSKK
jgi:hypothetical protein